MRFLWLYAFMIVSSLLVAAESLVLVVNTAKNRSTVGVLVDKENRLFLTSHQRAFGSLLGGKMEISGPHGRYRAKIITEDPLYGLCVVQAESLKAVEGLTDAVLASNMVTLGRAAHLATNGRFDFYQNEVQCGARADVFWSAHPAQNVFLYAGVGRYDDGTIFVNDDGAVCSLWQGDGWVPLSNIKRIVDKAQKHVRENTHDFGQDWCFAGCTFAYESVRICEKLLRGHVHKSAFALMVASVRGDAVFKPGDILLSVAGVDVSGDFEAMMQVLRATTDSSVECAVIRYGEKILLQVPLTLLEEKWLPYFSLRDGFVFAVNQREHYKSGLPEGTLLWGCAMHPAWILDSVNGKRMTYADFEALHGRKKPYEGPINIVIRLQKVRNESYWKHFPHAPWVIRRLDPLD